MEEGAQFAALDPAAGLPVELLVVSSSGESVSVRALDRLVDVAVKQILSHDKLAKNFHVGMLFPALCCSCGKTGIRLVCEQHEPTTI